MIQFRIKYPYEYKLAKRSEITYYCDIRPFSRILSKKIYQNHNNNNNFTKFSHQSSARIRNL